MFDDVTYPYGVDGKDEWEDYEDEQQAIARHVATCTADGFCLVCQSL